MALILGVLLYFYTAIRINNKNKTSVFLLVAILLTGLFFVFSYTSEFTDNLLINRFIGQDETELGSGRLEIYQSTLVMISESQFLPLLFGHGYNSVVVDSPLHTAAHNDFLEVLYDFGLIGFTLYLLLIIEMFKIAIRMNKDKSIYAPTFIYTLVVFLCFSLVSSVIRQNNTLVLFSVSFGIINSLYIQEQNENRNINVF